MPDETKFAVYFSHSWKPHDVDLNLLAWSEVCGACELLVDVPEEGGADPPYYITRIEELLRRSDLFLCVLSHRGVPGRPRDGTDAALQCSEYAAFEIRLAERFNIPRLVLYERSTGFKSPRSSRPDEEYIPFDRGPPDALPDQRHWRNIIAPKIHRWVEWANERSKPASYEQPSLAVSLYPPDAPDAAAVGAQLEAGLNAAGYERVALRAAFRSNTEAFQILHAAGLVVAELGSGNPVASELWTAAHALGIPAIRAMRSHDGLRNELPWFLRGHPGGYQDDIVTWKQPEDLPAQIGPRARAMFRISRALGDEETRRYLHSKRYAQYFVFISHTLKPPHRGLVENIYQLVGERYVRPFEYHMANESGEDWKKALDEQLHKTTHMVVLLTEGYEQSVVCTYEIEEILKRGAEVGILPFMAEGRSVPHPKLGHLHHRLLSAPDPRANAELVVKQVMEVLISAGAS